MEIEAYEKTIRSVVPQEFFDQAARIVEAHKPLDPELKDFEIFAQLRNEDLEDPRFDPNLTYTSEQFLFTARRLAELHKGDKEIEDLVKSWEKWIGDDKTGIIRWEESENDGTIIPIRSRPLEL